MRNVPASAIKIATRKIAVFRRFLQVCASQPHHPVFTGPRTTPRRSNFVVNCPLSIVNCHAPYFTTPQGSARRPRCANLETCQKKSTDDSDGAKHQFLLPQTRKSPRQGKTIPPPVLRSAAFLIESRCARIDRQVPGSTPCRGRFYDSRRQRLRIGRASVCRTDASFRSCFIVPMIPDFGKRRKPHRHTATRGSIRSNAEHTGARNDARSDTACPTATRSARESRAIRTRPKLALGF